MKPVYRDSVVHAMEHQCSTCVFRPGNPMYLREGRLKAMIKDSLEHQSGFACHQTLGGAEALCYELVQRYGDQIWPMRLAAAMGVMVYDGMPNRVDGR